MKGCDIMLIQKNKKKSHSGGLLGAAKTTTKAPYKKYARTPDMYAFGENSSFITPETEEKRNQSPKGIKR